MGHSTCRIAYVSGPIDAAQVYDEWQSESQSDYYGTVYLLQLYEILEQVGAEALVVTTLPGASGSWERRGVKISNIPMPQSAKGVFYHLAMLLWALRCQIAIIRFRADAAILTAGQDYFWAFAPLRYFGVRLIASLHCTLWPKYARRKVHLRLLDWLNGRLFYPACEHIQANSDEAGDQVRQIANRLITSPRRFVANYDAARFAHARKPACPPEGSLFRLLYVGRLSENKGVFDMVRILELLQKRDPGRFALDICGSGPAEAGLVKAVRDSKLHRVIRVRGECSTQQLQQLYGDCHAVLIPTRSDFEEGQPKVAFEAVLNFRPVVMSAACPALADVAEATVEARVDDVEDYAAAIEALSNSRELYDAKVSGAKACRLQYLDRRRSYGAVLRPAILAVAGPIGPGSESAFSGG